MREMQVDIERRNKLILQFLQARVNEWAHHDYKNSEDTDVKCFQHSLSITSINAFHIHSYHPIPFALYNVYSHSQFCYQRERE